MTSYKKLWVFALSALTLPWVFSSCGPYISPAGSVIQVEQYGANGGDLKDDTKSLTNIFNSLKANQHVQFPKGIFILSGPLNIRVPGVTVSGEGEETIIRFSNKYDLYARYKSRVGMLNILNNDVTIKNIKLDQNFRASGRKDGQAPLVGGILIGGTYLGSPKRTSGVRIKNCHVFDYYGDAISAFNASTDDIEITDNRITSAFVVGNWSMADDRGGQQSISVTGGRGIKINNNIIEGSLDDAIATHARAYDVEIKDNKITTTAGRILLAGAHNALVENNEITYIQSANGGGAIWVTFENQANPHRAADVSDNVKILNNKIKVMPGVDNQGGYLIRLLGPGDNVVIEGNIIEANFTNNGIQITDFEHKLSGWIIGTNYVVKNNTIKNCKWSIVVDPRKSGKDPKVEIENNVSIDNKFNKAKVFKVKE